MGHSRGSAATESKVLAGRKMEWESEICLINSDWGSLNAEIEWRDIWTVVLWNQDKMITSEDNASLGAKALILVKCT